MVASWREGKKVRMKEEGREKKGRRRDSGRREMRERGREGSGRIRNRIRNVETSDLTEIFDYTNSHQT